VQRFAVLLDLDGVDLVREAVEQDLVGECETREAGRGISK
jgi:hypothetical protein